MRNGLQALNSKVVPVIASITELVGKILGVVLLVPALGYVGICLIEPITWLSCTPIVLISFYKNIKKFRLQEAGI